MRPRRAFALGLGRFGLSLGLFASSLAPGCARSRTFTIYSKPADAKLIINGVEFATRADDLPERSDTDTPSHAVH